MSKLDHLTRHVPVEERPEVKLFAAELKRLFNSLNMSLGLFCKTNPNIDKSALSRYLNGKRIPRDRWLLDRLFALRVEAGTPLTGEARNHLIELQLAALQVAHPHDYRVRQATDQLNGTVTALRESKRHIVSLENELVERTRQLADLTAANEQLRTAWDAERLATQQAIDDLTTQLSLARNNHARAEERQRELEDLLEILDTTHLETLGSDVPSTGARFQTTIEALQAPTAQKHIAAIHELVDIAQQNPAFREAVAGTLLGHLRNTTTAPEDHTPSLLPVAPHNAEPLHAAIHALLKLKNRQLPGVDLRGIDLCAVKIGSVGLRAVNLSSTNLREANLREANLHGANLHGADLSRATLDGTNLSRANLRQVTLYEADLNEADLRRADLDQVDLRGEGRDEGFVVVADLSRASLVEADLSGAQMRGAWLREAHLEWAKLREANLAGADLTGANLSGADLHKVNLSKAKLREANLAGADLTGANLSGADLIGADLSGANLHGTQLNEEDLIGANLSEADLRKVIGRTSAEIRAIANSWTGTHFNDIALSSSESSEMANSVKPSPAGDEQQSGNHRPTDWTWSPAKDLLTDER